MDSAIIEKNDAALRAITVELEDFEERCSKESHATQADWDCWWSDWEGLFYIYISLLIDRVDTLTPNQKEQLIALIKRARGLKGKILEHDYLYPEVIDRDYAWMKG